MSEYEHNIKGFSALSWETQELDDGRVLIKEQILPNRELKGIILKEFREYLHNTAPKKGKNWQFWQSFAK